MPAQSPAPFALFEEQYPCIERTLRRTTRRRFLSEDEADEFISFAYGRLLANDCAILASFRGESRWETFLTVVAQRLFLDFRDHRWGKWRPCAFARRLGDVGILLDRLIHRDGFSVEEAISMLRRNHRVPEEPEVLRKWAEDFPHRGRPLQVGEECLEGHALPERTEERLLQKERQQEIGRFFEVLERLLSTRPAEDQLMVKMRYMEGLRVSEIARVLNLPQKPLYRRIETLLRRLSKDMEQQGFGQQSFADLLRGV